MVFNWSVWSTPFMLALYSRTTTGKGTLFLSRLVVSARPVLVEPKCHQLLSSGGLSLCGAIPLPPLGLSALPRRHPGPSCTWGEDNRVGSTTIGPHSSTYVDTVLQEVSEEGWWREEIAYFAMWWRPLISAIKSFGSRLTNLRLVWVANDLARNDARVTSF